MRLGITAVNLPDRTRSRQTGHSPQIWNPTWTHSAQTIIRNRFGAHGPRLCGRGFCSRRCFDFEGRSRMTRPPSVNLHLAEAQSCITVARTLLVDQMREDVRKQIEELMVRAENKIDAASAVLNNLRSQLDDVGKQL